MSEHDPLTFEAVSLCQGETAANRKDPAMAKLDDILVEFLEGHEGRSGQLEPDEYAQLDAMLKDEKKNAEQARPKSDFDPPTPGPCCGFC